jgi:diguanylate cyclase (GGDEF)-like protein/PAS domain S-box-containing protein
MRFAELAEEAFIAFRKGKITEWNRAAEKIFSLSQKEALGQEIEIIPSFLPEKTRNLALKGKALEKERVYFKGKHLLLSSGRYGEEDHLFFSDVTEKDRALEKLEALEKSPDLLLLLFNKENELQEWTGEDDIFKGLLPGENLFDLFEGKIMIEDGQQEATSRSGAPLLLDISLGEEITVIVRNITEKESVRKRTRALESLLENSEEAAILIDEKGKIYSWNQSAEKLYGFTEKEVKGENISIIQSPTYQEKEEKARKDLLQSKEDQNIEIERWHRDGEVIPISLSLGKIEDSPLISLIEHDKRMERRFENRLQFLTEHDDMTSLKNREGFMREILEKTHNRDDETLLIFDVDNFKFVNEAYGHDTGDKLLSMIGEELEEESSGRTGADQFSILLSESDIEKAKEWGENLLYHLREKARKDLRLPIGFSGGLIYVLPNDDRDGEEILNAAELALHEAKERGRGTIVINKTRERQINWSRKLEQALQENNLALFAQPIQDIKTDEIKSYELLLRLDDPDLGIVSPDKFLASAERLGLISEIDRWVAEEGIALARDGMHVEINLSGRSMTDENLFHFLARKMKDSRPENIVFEITETTAIASLQEAVRFSEKIRHLGCSFALDDFGVGFGSFSYLKNLPLQILKIDGEFVRNLPHSKADQAILKAIVSLADGLELKTIAEWVDSEETYHILREIGIDMAQGYWIGKPKPIEEIKRQHGL